MRKDKVSPIAIYCRCEHCAGYFEVGKRIGRLRKYCSRKCKRAAQYIRSKHIDNQH